MKPLTSITLGFAFLISIAAFRPVLSNDSTAQSREAPPLRSGAEVYRHLCQGCHMPQAEGAVGAGAYPKLAQNPNLRSWQYVALTIINGRAAMPPFGLPIGQTANPHSAILSDVEVADTVNFVRTHFGNVYLDTVGVDQIRNLPHPDR